MFDKKIPVAIFKGEELKVPMGYRVGGYGAECDILFSEDKFPEEERYIFSQLRILIILVMVLFRFGIFMVRRILNLIIIELQKEL